MHRSFYDRTRRRVRDLSSGPFRIQLDLEVRRVQCRQCGAVKRERLAFLADNPFYTQRFAYYVGRRCRAATIKDIAEELRLDWDAVKELDKQYMRAQLKRAGTPGPNAIGIDPAEPEMRRAVAWLLARQHSDGGWGECSETYWPEVPPGEAPYSAPSQTAWALLGLMAVGEVRNPAVARGVTYLIETQNPSGSWDEPWFTAVGFPRVFFLRYHGYPAYFPLWALARYRHLMNGKSARVPFGI